METPAMYVRFGRCTLLAKKSDSDLVVSTPVRTSYPLPAYDDAAHAYPSLMNFARRPNPGGSTVSTVPWPRKPWAHMTRSPFQFGGTSMMYAAWSRVPCWTVVGTPLTISGASGLLTMVYG